MKVLEAFLLLICLPVITTLKLPPYEISMMCADGDAHDKLFPDYSCFTCKPGPGKFVKCIYLSHSLKHPFHCPKYGYVSGWHVVGQKVKVKCCTEPGLHYSNKDCRNYFNNDVAQGRIYRVDKGKVITGFRTFDGGVTYFNTECWYNSSPKFNFLKIIKVY